MYGIYYNALFDSLIISKSDDEIKEIKNYEDKNLTVLKTKEDFAGTNIFNVSKDIHHIHESFNSFNKDVIDYANKRLEGIIKIEQEKQFVVGHVLECESIEGTHLHLLKVDLGNGKINQIVCGAKNIAKDQFVVVALPGAWMPNGMHIVPGKLRGFDSLGMVCSARELALLNSDYNKEGIIVLPEEFKNKIGQDFFGVITK